MNTMRAQAEEFTYADMLTWSDHERWELIDGFAYNISPAPSYRHQQISAMLVVLFGSYLEGKPCGIFAAPFDVRLPKPMEDEMSATTVVQPDLTIVGDRKQLDERGCLGSPTMVIEMLSPATAKKDLREKLHCYEQAGIPEYWIISPADKTLMVFTLDTLGRYGAPVVYGGNEQAPVGVLPGLIIELGRVFAE